MSPMFLQYCASLQSTHSGSAKPKVLYINAEQYQQISFLLVHIDFFMFHSNFDVASL